MSALIVRPYDPSMQPAIDKMMQAIQDEFSEAITTHHSTVIKDVYKDANQRFWVATDDDGKIAGTVGVKFNDDFAEVKRMFVHPGFRGPQFPTATLLLNKAISFSREIRSKRIYLGTMTQFKAAQRFYEKSGFIKIQLSELPGDYKLNPMDSVFYRMDLH